MPKSSIVYIDGFNFYYGAVKDTKCKWLNLERFFGLLRPVETCFDILEGVRRTP